MKQLSSYLVLNVNGGDRVSYTYDEIDDNSGELVNANVKESFYVVDAALAKHVEAIRKWVRENKLAGQTKA